MGPTECRPTHSDTPSMGLVHLSFISPTNQPMPGSFPLVIQIWCRRTYLLGTACHSEFRHGPQDLPRRHGCWRTRNIILRNCVSLEISWKELADLSFVDLSGLIVSVGQMGHDHDVDLIKNLVTSYIEKESCMILLTVACESQSLNCHQGAYQLVRRLRGYVLWRSIPSPTGIVHELSLVSIWCRSTNASGAACHLETKHSCLTVWMTGKTKHHFHRTTSH